LKHFLGFHDQHARIFRMDGHYMLHDLEQCLEKRRHSKTTLFMEIFLSSFGLILGGPLAVDA
jgi:hypothetical protein